MRNVFIFPLLLIGFLSAIVAGVGWSGGASVRVQKPDPTLIKAGTTPKVTADANAVPPPAAEPMEPASDPKQAATPAAEPQTLPVDPPKTPTADTKPADVKKEDPAPEKESAPDVVVGESPRKADEVTKVPEKAEPPPLEDGRVVTAPESSYDAGEKQNVSGSEVLWGKSVQECLIEMKSDCIVTMREKDGRLSTWCPNPQDPTARMCDERAEAIAASK